MANLFDFTRFLLGFGFVTAEYEAMKPSGGD